MKILILGHGRHGKDTLSEILRDIAGLKFESSSMAAMESAVWPVMSKKYGYIDMNECYDDRVNHRDEWRQLITDYNTPDKGRLCREILERNDMYVGMRCPDEYSKTCGLFDLIFWVSAYPRIIEDDESMGIQFDSHEMIYVDNSGDIEELRTVAGLICKELLRV